MTIEIKRRRKKGTKFDQAIGMARNTAEKDLTGIHEVIEKEKRKENKLKGAAIRRYAKKHELELWHHPKPWIFRSIVGQIQIAMPAGYFTRVNGVLENIVIT